MVQILGVDSRLVCLGQVGRGIEVQSMLSAGLTAILLLASFPCLANGQTESAPKVITINQIDCRDWRRTVDGWGPTRNIVIKLKAGGSIGMGPTSSFSALPVDGMNLAAVLDQVCGE